MRHKIDDGHHNRDDVDAAPLLAVDNEPAKRLNESAAVFSEVMGSPDKGIPQDLLQNAHCIVIVPDLKTAAFGVGGKYGKGYLSCRNRTAAGWSAPAAVRIEDLAVKNDECAVCCTQHSIQLVVMSLKPRHRNPYRLFWRIKSKPRGRPRIPPDLQQLIADIAAANRTWGEERIAAELRVKLGLTVSPRTVRRYMRRKNRPGGGRSTQSWAARVAAEQRLGGLHHHYGLERAA